MSNLEQLPRMVADLMVQVSQLSDRFASEFSALHARIDRLEVRIDSFETEMRSFQASTEARFAEIRVFQIEMREFQAEMRGFQAEMREFQTEMRGFQTEMRAFQTSANARFDDVNLFVHTLYDDVLGRIALLHEDASARAPRRPTSKRPPKRRTR